MKYKKKPYKSRKIFKRKSGGGRFTFQGGAKHPSPLMMIAQTAPAGKGGEFLLKGLLQSMGFRVGPR